MALLRALRIHGRLRAAVRDHGILFYPPQRKPGRPGRGAPENPDWYKGSELLGMMMYTGAFGKTLKGVRQKLDYILEKTAK